MTLAAEPEVLIPLERQAPKSGALVRLVAAVVGLVALVAATTVSIGTGLLALLGMAIVGGVQRRRGRALTRTGHWVTACSTMAVVVFAAGGTLFASVPRAALDGARHAMDSTNVASATRRRPAWMERLYPQYRQTATNAQPSPSMVWLTTIFSLGITIVFFATVLGTLAWGAGMLLGLAMQGRLPPRGESFEELVTNTPFV